MFTRRLKYLLSIDSRLGIFNFFGPRMHDDKAAKLIILVTFKGNNYNIDVFISLKKYA